MRSVGGRLRDGGTCWWRLSKGVRMHAFARVGLLRTSLDVIREVLLLGKPPGRQQNVAFTPVLTQVTIAQQMPAVCRNDFPTNVESKPRNP